LSANPSTRHKIVSDIIVKDCGIGNQIIWRARSRKKDFDTVAAYDSEDGKQQQQYSHARGPGTEN
jgi:hypothetical protein